MGLVCLEDPKMEKRACSEDKIVVSILGMDEKVESQILIPELGDELEISNRAYKEQTKMLMLLK